MTAPAPVRLYSPTMRQLTLKMDQGGQESDVVLGFKGTGTLYTPADGQLVLNAAWAALRPAIISQVTCTGGIWRDCSGPGGLATVAGPPPSPAGGLAGGSVTAAAVCYLLSWQTASGGRSGRGRTFLPGVNAPIINADGRTIAAAGITLLNSAITSYLGSSVWASTGNTPAVLSFTKGQANLIVSGKLGTVLGIQRRRMRG